MFLNYPNNPTGATADQAFYEKAAAFAKKHDIHLIHDFAYGAFEFDQNPAFFIKRLIRSRARRVIRVIQKHQLGFFQDGGINLLKIRQIAVFRMKRHLMQLRSGHCDSR